MLHTVRGCLLYTSSEAAEQPDYVPDGARLVRICGLCHPDGSEISFSPGDIEKLLKGKKDEEHNLCLLYTSR